jgi:hypothetical protein
MAEKEIIDPQTIYFIKTLSRTHRKDYENYVINSIWHRLANPQIEVVSQQYVANKQGTDNRKHFFIDLYFPALNIGIECDEAYHKSQQEQDRHRELTIYDILNEIRPDSYEAIRIDTTLPFKQLDASIHHAVEKIKRRINEIDPPPWAFKSSQDYYSSKENITIFDKKGFSSINQACNILFNAGRSEITGGRSRAYFSIPRFKGTELEGHKLWFPKLSVQIKENDGSIKYISATGTGWKNELINQGSRIRESNEKNHSYTPDGKPRIVFLKYRDPLGFNEYKFMGIFEFVGREDGYSYFDRIRESCIILQPQADK